MSGREGLGVPYHPVVERFVVYPPLDAVALMLFAFVFVATVLATLRRPAAGLAALAFVLPFAFYHQLASTTITLPKIVLVGVFVGLLPRARESMRALHDARFVAGAFAAMVLALAASAFGAHDHGAVLREVLKWIEYGVLFCVAYCAFRADPDSRWIRTALFLSSVLVCFSALAQEILGSPSGIDFGSGTVPRIAGVLEGPNQLAGYLETAAAVVLAWTVEMPSTALASLAALVGITLMLTFSRGGMIGCAIVVAVIAIVVGRRALRGIAAFASGIVLGGVADAAWAYAAPRVAVLRNPKPGVDYSGGVGHRGELWQAALFFFRRHPVFGIGAGNYETSLAQAGITGVRTHANNWYLQSLAEGGIVLFAATIVLLAALITGLASRASRSTWALAALAATLALAVHQFADYLVFYPKIAEPWIVLCALGFASHREPCA